MAGRDSIDVAIRLRGQRKFAKEVEASATELESLGVKGARSIAAFSRQSDKLKSFGKSWTRNISLPVAGFAAVSGKFALDFDRSMRNVNSIAQLPERQFEKLRNSVLGLAGPTAQAPNTLAEGLYDIVSSGFGAIDGLKILRAAAFGASAGLTTTEVSTKAVTAVLNAYHLKADAAGRVTDTLFETVNRGVLTFEELASSVGDVLPFSSQLGVSINEVGASISTMTKQGLSAPESVTRLKNAMIALIKPSKPLKKLLDEMGTSGEALVSKRGFQGALEAIVAHTDGTKEALAELFPNIRGLGGVLSLTGKSTKAADEDLAAFKSTAGATQKVLAEQEKSAGFKLQRAWAKFQVTLIKFGDRVLPKALHVFQQFLPYVEQAVNLFAGLPVGVQAAVIAFGPLTSAVGYFASGAGRALLVVGKLSRATTVFSTTISEGGGLLSAFQAGSKESGVTGALSTAKGFAAALGPAVAAYGIGNIITSATSHDWKDAGYEAGGALAGGIAGFMVGGPIGAMLGVGIGSYGGELLSHLFGGGKKASVMRRETEHLTGALSSYRRSLSGLKGVEKRATTARQNHITAIKREKEASHHLARVLAQYGVNSGHATRAQRRLSEAQRAVTRAARAESRMNQLSGFRLKEFRIQSLHATASIKQLLPTQHRRIKAMREEVNHGRTGIAFLNELEKLEQRVGTEKRKLTGIYAEAESKAGRPWAKRLQSLTTLQSKFGTKGRTLTSQLRDQTDAFRKLKEEGAVVPGVYKKIAEEIRKTSRELANFNAQVEGIGPPRLHPQGPGGKHHPSPQRTHPGRHGRRGGDNAQSLTLPARRPSALTRDLGVNLSDALNITVQVPLHLDGKKVAESTARASAKARARE